jgi:hypothetical protein
MDRQDHKRRSAYAHAALVGATLTALAAAAPAAATRGYQIPFEDHVAKSALIARVHVDEVDPTWENDRSAPAVTRVIIRIRDVLHGEHRPGDTLELFLPGGVAADGSVLEHVGMPQLEVGSDYLVFIVDGDWYSTPFTNWRYSVLRETRIAGKNVLVDCDGRVVDSVTSAGFSFGRKVAEQFGFVGMLRGAGVLGDDAHVRESPPPAAPRVPNGWPLGSENAEVPDRATDAKAQQAIERAVEHARGRDELIAAIREFATEVHAARGSEVRGTQAIHARANRNKVRPVAQDGGER